ncbi:MULTISPECIES: hypothetical protein [Pseudomonas]|uniref:Uncharacterized protein n=2 Tax=Pseudomonas TaxID=286 RepID=A0A0W0HFD6_PSEFL|nr:MULTISPECIES: hypothetical protein [Pseudomonas]KTB59605.1 hypothetical protein AO063_03240 [Pseudomonas fluorescens ICMP 11288]RMQ89549.1 hypothetical protein ALP97_200108 [Pseudomonas salomonii]
MPAYFDLKVFSNILRYLILAAQAKRVVPYNELENAFGLSHNMAGFYAGTVGNFCCDNGWPLLNALVVNTTTCMPSEGFDAYLEDSDMSWGDCLAQCWKHFHLTTSRELQVRNFSGLTTLVRKWGKDGDQPSN